MAKKRGVQYYAEVGGEIDPELFSISFRHLNENELDELTRKLKIALNIKIGKVI